MFHQKITGKTFSGKNTIPTVHITVEIVTVVAKRNLKKSFKLNGLCI